jgi:hypothetical protein
MTPLSGSESIGRTVNMQEVGRPHGRPTTKVEEEYLKAKKLQRVSRDVTSRDEAIRCKLREVEPREIE